MSLRGASCFWRASAAAAGERGVAGAGKRHSDGVVMRTSIPVCVGSSRFLSWILGLTCATLAKCFHCVNAGHVRKSARSVPWRLTCLADRAGEEYLLASSGSYLFERGGFDEKISSGKCVCRVNGGGHACGGGLWPREKRQPRSAQNYALRRFEVDADHQGLRPCDGGWRPKRRGSAIRGAPSGRRRSPNPGARASNR